MIQPHPNPRKRNENRGFVGVAGQGRKPPLITPPACAQVAQSVEQWIENPRVGSSILSLGTITQYANVRRCSGEFKFLRRIKHM